MPKRSSLVVRERRHQARRKVLLRRLKIGLFAAAALAVLGLAALLVLSPIRAVRAPAPTAPASAGEERQIVTTMAGFEPQTLRVPAGQPFTVRLVNPDSQFHTDGGGWHQFRLETLDVDVRVPPRSERSQVFDGLAAGRYEFYCDICCGGKESPTMRGVIEVTG
ncbi:MAG: cupredoxin domain-containing protein [Armatimonadetes bacterium]|nr:cupredoxin domain-containing protein [Armatimonadota bacterium]